MPVNPDAVGEKGTPTKRSWKSKDALLYALGVGAGVDELAFTTENTKDTPQRVLPTMAVVIGMGGVPFDKIGADMVRTISNLNKTIVQAEETLKSVDTMFAQDSAMSQELQSSMRELAETARSLRILADYLERHPEALLRGKEK